MDDLTEKNRDPSPVLNTRSVTVLPRPTITSIELSEIPQNDIYIGSKLEHAEEDSEMVHKSVVAARRKSTAQEKIQQYTTNNIFSEETKSSASYSFGGKPLNSAPSISNSEESGGRNNGGRRSSIRESIQNYGLDDHHNVTDDELLERMGYKQELYRGFTGLMNFSFCFTAVAVVSSVAGLFPYGMSTGGPVVMIWGWIIGSILTVGVCLNLAEICSTYPSAGSVYHWSGCLAPPKYAPICSYITVDKNTINLVLIQLLINVIGWFNFIGNSAGDAFFANTFSNAVASAYASQPANVISGAEMSLQTNVAIGMLVCVVWASQCLMRMDRQGWFNNFAALYQLAATIVIIATTLAMCPTTIANTNAMNNFNLTSINGSLVNATGNIVPGTTSQVFFTYSNYTGLDDTNSWGKLYVVIIGTLFTFYSLTGYEAAGHVSEETENAQETAPLGILWTGIMSGITGLVFMIGLLYATAGDVDYFVSNGLTVSNIFTSCSGEIGGLALQYIMTINMYFSGMASFTVTTRIGFAMARDGAFPWKQKLAYVTKKDKVPLGSIVLTLLCDIFLISLNLISSSAFTAVTSIATIGYQISYSIPILLRITVARNTFPKGKFNLGIYAVPMGICSFSFLLFTSLLFVLPEVFPVSISTMNWTVVVLGVTFFLGSLHWIFSGRHHFKGPKRDWRKLGVTLDRSQETM